MAQRHTEALALEMISNERQRQIDLEGFTLEHDERCHGDGVLAMAAACYAAPCPIFTIEFCGDGEAHDAWPLGDEWDKREQWDDLRRLTVAGALIVAEIERKLSKRGV